MLRMLFLYLKVWSIVLVARESRLVVGSSDRKLRVWAVEHSNAEQEVGGATSKTIIGQKRTPSDDNDDIMMMQNDVTEQHERNVRSNVVSSMVTIAIITESLVELYLLT